MREIILIFLKKELFHITKMYLKEKKEESKKERSKNLFKEYFDFEVTTVLAKKIYERKDKKENNDLVE